MNLNNNYQTIDPNQTILFESNPVTPDGKKIQALPAGSLSVNGINFATGINTTIDDINSPHGYMSINGSPMNLMQTSGSIAPNLMSSKQNLLETNLTNSTLIGVSRN